MFMKCTVAYLHNEDLLFLKTSDVIGRHSRDKLYTSEANSHVQSDLSDFIRQHITPLSLRLLFAVRRVPYTMRITERLGSFFVFFVTQYGEQKSSVGKHAFKNKRALAFP